MIIIHFINKKLYFIYFFIKEYLFKNTNFNFITASIFIIIIYLTYLTDIKNIYKKIKKDFLIIRYVAEF